MGWVMIGIVVFNTGCNISYATFETLQTFLKNRKDAKEEENRVKKLRRRIENRKLIIAQNKFRFLNLRKEIDILDDIDFCRSWVRTRRWLKLRQIDIND